MYKLRTHAFDRMPQIEILGDSRSVKPTHGPTPTPGGSRKRESSPGEPRRQNPAQEVPRDQPRRLQEVPGDQNSAQDPEETKIQPRSAQEEQNPAQEPLGGQNLSQELPAAQNPAQESHAQEARIQPRSLQEARIQPRRRQEHPEID